MTLRTPRLLAISFAISAALTTTGCAGGPHADAPPATVTATATVTAPAQAGAEGSDEPSNDPVETPENSPASVAGSSTTTANAAATEIAHQHCPDSTDALGLVNDWADVLEGRGTSLHELKVSGFKDSVADLQASSARGAIPCPAFEELANVNMQISGLEIMVEHLNVPDDEFYQAVTTAANERLEVADHGGLVFKQP
jgi:hypothetical protein